MLSEMILLFLMLSLSVQISSMISSIIIIPSSLLLVLSFSNSSSQSGILMMIFVMIFIGGLLVLLMSVTSISLQDQSSFVSWIWITSMVLLSSLMLLEAKQSMNTINSLISFGWMSQISETIVLPLILLIWSLTVMTLILQTFKGMVRSL